MKLKLIELTALTFENQLTGDLITIGNLSVTNIPSIITEPNSALRKISEEIKRLREQDL